MNEIFNTNTHLRKNILTGNYVLCSPNRNKRPWQGKIVENIKDNLDDVEYDENCYLCAGNKRNNNEINPNYTNQHIFINDYSALKPDTELIKFKDNFLNAKTENGICKVICYSPKHNLTLSNMPISAIEKVVKLWISEYKTLSKLKKINNVQIFENKGEIMGCSNKHPHGQIWANNTIPNEIKLKNKHQKKYFIKTRKILLLEYLKQELKLNQRIIFENDSFVWLVPFWAVWPFETIIIPKKHAESIDALNEMQIKLFSEILSIANKTYDKLFNISFPYSAGFQQKPTKLNKDYFHWQWHFCFYPPLLRSAKIKKFMVGYEMFAQAQRDFTPEFAAKKLKENV